MRPTTEEEEAWWPPTLVPSGFGRTLLAWWTISALSQRTFFWIDSRVAIGASAMSSYLTAGRRDGPEARPDAAPQRAGGGGGASGSETMRYRKTPLRVSDGCGR